MSVWGAQGGPDGLAVAAVVHGTVVVGSPWGGLLAAWATGCAPGVLMAVAGACSPAKVAVSATRVDPKGGAVEPVGATEVSPAVTGGLNEAGAGTAALAFWL